MKGYRLLTVAICLATGVSALQASQATKQINCPDKYLGGTIHLDYDITSTNPLLGKGFYIDSPSSGSMQDNLKWQASYSSLRLDDQPGLPAYGPEEFNLGALAGNPPYLKVTKAQAGGSKLMCSYSGSDFVRPHSIPPEDTLDLTQTVPYKDCKILVQNKTFSCVTSS